MFNQYSASLYGLPARCTFSLLNIPYELTTPPFTEVAVSKLAALLALWEPARHRNPEIATYDINIGPSHWHYSILYLIATEQDKKRTNTKTRDLIREDALLLLLDLEMAGLPSESAPYVRDEYYRAGIRGGKLDSLRIFLSVDVNWRERYKMLNKFAEDADTELSMKSARYLRRAKQELRHPERWPTWVRSRRGIPDAVFSNMKYFRMFKGMESMHLGERLSVVWD